MKPIDKNLLREMICNLHCGLSEDNRLYVPLNEVLRCIDSIPTIDPVKHGRWINVYGDYTVAECSCCKNQLDALFDKEANGALWEGFVDFYKFCPACGAAMDDGVTYG